VDITLKKNHKEFFSAQKKTELALCLSVRVPQVSKVRFLFSSLDAISPSLVGYKAIFYR
jgi:hypothetical protein